MEHNPRRRAQAQLHGQRGGPTMTIGSNDPRELAIMFFAVIISLGLLVIIDRLGTLRRGELDDDEEEI
jgi:hypothetical protein